LNEGRWIEVEGVLVYSCPRCGSDASSIKYLFTTEKMHFKCRVCGKRSYISLDDLMEKLQIGEACVIPHGKCFPNSNGNWIGSMFMLRGYVIGRCSRCKTITINAKSNYCVLCGKKMRILV
jgi:ribosomal protein L37E